jgi:predicted SAM-dependent methyltransferase
MSTRRLHIGGQIRTTGWEVLDANPGPYVDHVGDAGDLERFPTGTFTEVYASHVLEHFDYKDELLATLKEWHRVLAPGGMLHVSVPDMDTLARLFVDRQRLNPDERYLVMRMIFGGHIDQYDYHLVGLNEEFLRGYLVAAGFAQAARVPEFGIWDDTSTAQLKGVPISLNMSALKARD